MGEMKSCRQRAYQSSAWLVHAKCLLKAGACPNTQWQQGVCYPSASWVIPAASGSHKLYSDARLPRAAGTEAAAPQRWGLHEHLPEFGGMGDLWADTYLIEKTFVRWVFPLSSYWILASSSWGTALFLLHGDHSWMQSGFSSNRGLQGPEDGSSNPHSCPSTPCNLE